MVFLLLLTSVVSEQHVGFGYGGQVEGVTFEVLLPRATVASLLPIGLEPAQLPSASARANSNTNETQHPVLFTFCVQLHVGAPFTGNA